MTIGGRAFFGALLGALLTLAIHPISRPFILGTSNRVRLDTIVGSLDSRARALAAPEDLLGASLWIQLGLHKMAAGQGLKPVERQSLLSVADAAIERDPRNAYWYQVKAVLLLAAHDRANAAKAWEDGSKSDFWKDYQTERLLRTRELLAGRSHAYESWEYAVVYYARSTDAAALIERAAREFLGSSDYDSPAGAHVRFVTLVNGDLLRSGGRSISISTHGANIVELSAYPPDLTSTVSPKRLWMGQTELLSSLASLHHPDQTNRARKAFRANEAWLALALHDDYRVFADNLSILSVVAAGTPVGCLLASLIGFVLWLLGWQVQRRLSPTARLSPLTVGIAAALISATVFLMSDSWIGALAVGLAAGFLIVSPNHFRQRLRPDFGPLFIFVMLVVSMGAVCAIVAASITNTAPAIALSPAVGIPSEFYARPALLALAIVILSTAFIACPLWALFCRVGTAFVLFGALRTIGSIMAVGSLVAAVLLAPVCVRLDRYAGDVLAQLVQNEPVYYLVQ